MREILFRGKRVDNGEWVKGSLVMVCNGETLKRYPCIVVSYNHDTFDWHEVKPKTVTQFTGFTGRNKARIFDGDLLRGGIYLSFEVRWDYMGGGWNIASASKDFEVIGNVFDNKNDTK